jgi:hypothetical protein
MSQAKNSITTHNTKSIAAIYIGRRVATNNKLSYFWQFDGEESPRGYTKRPVHSLIGERWEFQQADDGSVWFSGKNAPKRMGLIDDIEKIKEWTAMDEANYQMDVTQRQDRKLAARKTHFDAAIRPLKEMADKLRSNEERAAFIQRVQSELWRR